MITTTKTFLAGLLVWIMAMPLAHGQKIDDARMSRDIEIAENILGTLIKQQFEQERIFFTLEIRGYYQAGYGVTFRLPADYATPIAITMRGNQDIGVANGDQQNYTHSVGSGDPTYRQPTQAYTRASGTYSLNDSKEQKARNREQMDLDSVRSLYDFKVTTAIKNFMVDYGDLISQLPPTERIVVTSKGDLPRGLADQYMQYLGMPQRAVLSVEGIKSNFTAFKQGKLTRDQAMKTINIVNTVPVERVEPDMELLSTIFTRLYQPDLSKTYFTEESIGYEHLKDFGAVYYMQAFSAVRLDVLNSDQVAMPTLGLMDVDPETRDRKARELYPLFEQELKVNMLEYGRTLKSLANNESLIFNVTLTRCYGCGIPSTLELSIKGAVLKDFSAGKLDQFAALNKFQIKKGAPQ
jgi:hypothetical protein